MSGGWKETVLGDVCSQVTVGHVGKTSSHYREQGVAFLRTQNVSRNGLRVDTLKFVTQEFHDSLKKSQVQGGDVLLSRVVTDSVTCAVIPNDFGPANCANVILTRPGPKLDSRFLLHYIRSPQAQRHLLNQRVGAAQKVVNTKVVKAWPIPLPPLPEQKRIVAILDEAFGAIAKAKENAERNLANAKELFDSYLNRVFTEKGEGWEETTVGEICSAVEYGTSSKSQPTGDVPVLRMGNIQNREIDWSDLVYANNSEEIEKYSLREGDVLFNRTNSAEHVGKTCVYRGDRPAIFAGYLIRIHYERVRVDGEYLNYYLNSDEARVYGKTVMSRSVNQANINGTKLKGYRFPLAPLGEQRSIVARFNALQNETSSVETLYEKKITALAELKQSILQKAFTGQLTAKSPELEFVP